MYMCYMQILYYFSKKLQFLQVSVPATGPTVRFNFSAQPIPTYLVPDLIGMRLPDPPLRIPSLISRSNFTPIASTLA